MRISGKLGLLLAIIGLLLVGTAAQLSANDGLLAGKSAEDANISCPTITPDKRPALVLVESAPPDGKRLCVAALAGGVVRKAEIVSGRNVRVTQLDHAVFLVGTSEDSTVWKTTVIDLAKGTGKLLAEGTGMHCLRSEPKRGKAMLMTFDTNNHEKQLLELDLGTLNVTPRYTFMKASLGERFDNLEGSLSPDFRRIVAIVPASPNSASNIYNLEMTKLATMKTREIAKDVRACPPLWSSDSVARPPVEWISDTEVLYQDAPRPTSRESTLLHSLNRVNVDTGKANEVLRRALDLAARGGSLKINPLNGEMVYRDEFLLDVDKGTLKPATYPFLSVDSYRRSPIRVLHGDKLLYEMAGEINGTCISSSHRNFAYTLGRTPPYAIFVALAGFDRSLKVGEVSSVGLVGWIE